MFLVLVYSVRQQDKLGYILQFLEDHPVLVGVLTSLIATSLWLYKFLKQRRAEAFFGLYSQLLLYLDELSSKLIEFGLLNITDYEEGNVFSLLYTESYCKTICPSFAPEAAKRKLVPLGRIVEGLENTLLNADNNVYPKKAKPEMWYYSQQVLISFCEFLQHEEYHHTTNCMTDTSRPVHIVKCEKLLDAIAYIKQVIRATKY